MILNMYHEDEKGNEKMMDEVRLSTNQFRMSGALERREMNIKLNNKKAGTLIIEVQAFPPIGEHSKSSGNFRNCPKLGDSEFFVRLLILGSDTFVGSSSLLLRYADNKFSETLPTICFNLKTRYIDVNGLKVKLQIIETNGHERIIAKGFIRGVSGIIICYNVTNKETFISTQYWVEAFKELKLDKKIPVALTGTMIDLKDKREVTYEEGKQFALENGWSFFETSAKENIGVKELFQFIGTESIKYALNKQ